MGNVVENYLVAGVLATVASNIQLEIHLTVRPRGVQAVYSGSVGQHSESLATPGQGQLMVDWP